MAHQIRYLLRNNNIVVNRNGLDPGFIPTKGISASSLSLSQLSSLTILELFFVTTIDSTKKRLHTIKCQPFVGLLLLLLLLQQVFHVPTKVSRISAFSNHLLVCVCVLVISSTTTICCSPSSSLSRCLCGGIEEDLINVVTAAPSNNFCFSLPPFTF